MRRYFLVQLANSSTRGGLPNLVRPELVSMSARSRKLGPRQSAIRLVWKSKQVPQSPVGKVTPIFKKYIMIYDYQISYMERTKIKKVFGVHMHIYMVELYFIPKECFKPATPKVDKKGGCSLSWMKYGGMPKAFHPQF